MGKVGKPGSEFINTENREKCRDLVRLALTIVCGIVNCVQQCLLWPEVEEVMSQL